MMSICNNSTSVNLTYIDILSNTVEKSSTFYIMGSYCAILFLLSIFANLILLIWILKKESLKRGNNFLVLSLSLLNLFGALIELPLMTISAFNKK